jgi:hypothetical protein
MKNSFFKIWDNKLQVLHLESLRVGLYQVAGALFISVFFFVILAIIINFSENKPISPIFIGWLTSPVSVIIGILLPAAAIIFAQRFPPAPVVILHADTHNVNWKCGKNSLVIPYQKITFSPVRMPSKSGISNVFVMVTAIGNKPFFENDKVSNAPGTLYKKDLCLYKAGTKEEADESIEIIRKFMSGTLDEEDSFRL